MKSRLLMSSSDTYSILKYFTDFAVGICRNVHLTRLLAHSDL